MKPETVDSYCRLATLFARAILATGEELPDGIAEKLAVAPRSACEELNALALRSDALDDAIDGLLAITYQSMDAADARTAPAEADKAKIVAAFARAIAAHEAEEAEKAARAAAEAEEEAASAAEPEPEAEAEPEPVSEPEAAETLTVDEAAAALGVDKQSVYKYIKSGKVAAEKRGRSWALDAAAVRALAEARK